MCHGRDHAREGAEAFSLALGSAALSPPRDSAPQGLKRTGSPSSSPLFVPRSAAGRSGRLGETQLAGAAAWRAGHRSLSLPIPPAPTSPRTLSHARKRPSLPAQAAPGSPLPLGVLLSPRRAAPGGGQLLPACPALPRPLRPPGTASSLQTVAARPQRLDAQRGVRVADAAETAWGGGRRAQPGAHSSASRPSAAAHSLR